MGWEGTRLLTNGEHDELWRDAFKTIPELKGIALSLRRANAILIMKELHGIGKLNDDVYARNLLAIAKSEGYEF